MKKLKNTREKQKDTAKRPSNLAGKLKMYTMALLALLTALSEISCKDNKPPVTIKGNTYNAVSKKLQGSRKTQAEEYQDLIEAQKDYLKAVEEVNQGIQDSINAAAEVKREANKL